MHYSIEAKTLTFKQPAGTSRGVYRERKLWYVHLYDSIYHGIGECAPLFDLSCDYKEDMVAILDKACRSLVANGEIDYKGLKDFPSVLFALETAMLSLEGSRNGNSLCLYDNAFTRSEMGIPINGLVWMGTYEEMMKRMEEKLSLGFRCVKFKIGAIDFDKEIALLNHLRERFPADKVQLRVDANGGFSPAEAHHVLQILSTLDIHSIEQPIRQHQWEDMASLCKNTPVPIALDEELIGINDTERKEQLLDTIRPQYIILKPTLHGGLRGCEEWMRLARQRNIGYWVTSALESNVGLNAIAQWAAHTNNITMPQGLGTGQLFTTNYEQTDLEIQGDQLWFQSAKQRDFTKQVHDFRALWESDTQFIEVHTSGSTGEPKSMLVEKQRMINSAKATLDFLDLHPGDTALLCMPLRYIAGKMVVVRAIVGELRLICVAPSSRPFKTLSEPPVFAAITPMQAVDSLLHDHDARIMRGIKQLIIGGGAIPKELAEQLSIFPNCVWSTYGMTETLSHIAMRRLNGAKATDSYTPMQDVTILLNKEKCLEVTAPKVCRETLTTNDIAEINPDGTFVILGRKDNTICSGGIKLQIEDIEHRLRQAINVPFMLTSVSDNVLGEALVMIYEGNHSNLKKACLSIVNKYEVPRHFIQVDHIPLTETGKPARDIAKKIAKATAEKETGEPV